jgi:uncharacterized membrane protein YhiD involved in acid resistance
MALVYDGTSVTVVVASLTMLASAIIGFNRGARGHATGFRTTILIHLAASVAMIQTNISHIRIVLATSRAHNPAARPSARPTQLLAREIICADQG